MKRGAKLSDTMSSTTPLKRTRRNSDEAFSLLREIAGNRGLTLLTEQWNGAQFAYLFRCAFGHEFTRIGTVAMRGTVSCLECERRRVEQRFREALGKLGISCRERHFLGQEVRQHFTCSQVRDAARACGERGRALHAPCGRIGTQRHSVFGRSALTGAKRNAGKRAPLRPRFAVTVASRCAHKVARSRRGGIAGTEMCATCFRRRARVAGGQPGSRSRRRTVHAFHHFIRKHDRRRFEPDRGRSGDLDHVESA
ncbi:hypothetical protein EMIT0111MI5_200013 [Burkholderia sp. IT-111MI5]